MASSQTHAKDPNKTFAKRDHPVPEVAPSGSYGAPPPPAPAGDSYSSYGGGDKGLYYYYYPTEEVGTGEKYKDDKCAVEKILPTLILIDIFLGIIAGSLLGLIPSFSLANLINALPIPNVVLPAINIDKPKARMMEEVTNMVTSALENEECLPRMICETGRYAEGYTTFVGIMDFFTPDHFSNRMKVFKDAALKKTDCKSYNCSYVDWSY